ncbi:unnamed protein product [Arctogadus glacialis]
MPSPPVSQRLLMGPGAAEAGWAESPVFPFLFISKKGGNNPRSNIPISHLSAVPDPAAALSAAGVTTFSTNLMRHISFLQPRVRSPLPDCSQPRSEVALGKGAGGIPHRRVNHRGLACVCDAYALVRV